MKIVANNPEEYLAQLSPERREAMELLRHTILENIPAGFKEEMSYGMIGYVVPHALYPAGYHCDPKLPLPFLSIANQKNFIGLYHMGIYANESLLRWFQEEYPKYVKTKLDMGKSCVRFKKPDQIPYPLIAELVAQITPQRWIEIYEENLKR